MIHFALVLLLFLIWNIPYFFGKTKSGQDWYKYARYYVVLCAVLLSYLVIISVVFILKTFINYFNTLL
jgi:hypothetical protein